MQQVVGKDYRIQSDHRDQQEQQGHQNQQKQDFNKSCVKLLYCADKRISTMLHVSALVNILLTYEEAREAAIIEKVEKAEKEKELNVEAEKDFMYDDSSDRDAKSADGTMSDNGHNKQVKIKRNGRKPGHIQLLHTAILLAVVELAPGIICEIFSSAYALVTQRISEGYEKHTVIWIPDIAEYTFPFNSLRPSEKHLAANGYTDLSATPWPVAMLLRATSQLENISQVANNKKLNDLRAQQKYQVVRTLFAKNSSDGGSNIEECYDIETSEVRSISTQTHVDTPESNYAKLEQQEMYRKIRLMSKGFLRKLEYDDRRIFYMYYWNNLGARKVAQKLNVKNHSNIQSKVKALRNSIAKHFAKVIFGADESISSLKAVTRFEVEQNMFEDNSYLPRTRVRIEFSRCVAIELLKIVEEGINDNCSGKIRSMLSSFSKHATDILGASGTSDTSSTVSDFKRGKRTKREIRTEEEQEKKQALKELLEEHVKHVKDEFLVHMEPTMQIAFLGVLEQKVEKIEILAATYEESARSKRMKVVEMSKSSTSHQIVDENVYENSDSSEACDRNDIEAEATISNFKYNVFRKLIELMHSKEHVPTVVMSKEDKEHKEEMRIFRKKSFAKWASLAVRHNALKEEIQQDLFSPPISDMPTVLKIFEELAPEMTAFMKNAIQEQTAYNMRLAFEDALEAKDSAFWQALKKSQKKSPYKPKKKKAQLPAATSEGISKAKNSA